MTKLDIISDPICPWCYIGKAHLDRALEAAPEHNFDIEWHPFQLNPDMPAGGMDRRLYLETKFGGKQQAVRAYAPVAEHAQSAGLEIAFDKIKTTPNTSNAHRLIHWAGIEGCQTPVVAGLFRAYFKLGLDIGDPAVLAQVGERNGMDGALVSKLLSSVADSGVVAEKEAAGRQMGITSVPTFIVAGQHVVQGAQSPDLWQRVITELAEIQAAEIQAAENPSNAAG